MKFNTVIRQVIGAGVILCSSTGGLIYSSSIRADEPDAKHGESIYKERCGGCHDTRVHTRTNRIVHTYEDLVNRVRFCDTNAKTNFSEKEIYDVSEYLNDTFYKFIKVKK